MNTHVTLDELRQWRNGALPASEVLEIARHLGSCSDCRTAAGGAIPLDASARAIREQVRNDHPAVDTVLAAFAAGMLSPDDRAAVAEHLLQCTRCREDVADLRAIRTGPVRWKIKALAAAACVAAAIATGVVTRDAEPRDAEPPPISRAPVSRQASKPEPPQQATLRSDWGELLSAARAGAPLEVPPFVTAMRKRRDVLRGGAAREAAAIAPAGVVVEEQQPELRWEAPRTAQSRVSIFVDRREVLRSKPLTRTRWTPPRPLQRGVTYTWEVEVTTDGDLHILPEPPAPPLQFHVAAEEDLAEIEAARRAHPGEHLLLGILYARSGLTARARQELERASGADTAVAGRLLRDLESWSVR